MPRQRDRNPYDAHPEFAQAREAYLSGQWGPSNQRGICGGSFLSNSAIGLNPGQGLPFSNFGSALRNDEETKERLFRMALDAGVSRAMANQWMDTMGRAQMGTAYANHMIQSTRGRHPYAKYVAIQGLREFPMPVGEGARPAGEGVPGEGANDDPGDPPEDPLPEDPGPELPQGDRGPGNEPQATDQMPHLPGMMGGGTYGRVYYPPGVGPLAFGNRHHSLGGRAPRFAGQPAGGMPPLKPPGAYYRAKGQGAPGYGRYDGLGGRYQLMSGCQGLGGRYQGLPRVGLDDRSRAGRTFLH